MSTLRDRWIRSTAHLPLGQMKPRDFLQGLHAYRYFWLGYIALVVVFAFCSRR